jgi:glycosyltransferase involved in cell wall biosynthesis
MDDSRFNVLHLSLSDLEGGAARAAYRTHVALRSAGHHSRMLVRRKLSNDRDVELVDPLPPWPSRRRRLRARIPGLRPRTPQATVTFNFDLEESFDPRSLFRLPREYVDVVCLHRITRFLTVRQIRALRDHYRCPLVWVVLDQQPVTGGCHYSLGCDRYTERCGRCPLLRSDDEDDASRRLWLRKERFLADLPLAFVTPSGDTERWVQESSLFGDHRVQRIPLPIDGEIFRPIDRRIAREALALPAEAKIVLVAATHFGAPRKGAQHAVQALGRLAELLGDGHQEDVFVLVAGAAGDELLAAVPFRGATVGRLSDDVALALVYQAADVFLSPSVADAGPMTVPEAMLCGTPPVAFALGYANDLVDGPDTGRVAPLGDSDALATGLLETLERERGVVMRACRDAAAGFESARVAAAHAELYRSLARA